MTITKKQALDLFNALNSVGDLRGLKFSYAVAKNMHKLKNLMEELQEEASPSDEYGEYVSKMMDIQKKFEGEDADKKKLDKEAEKLDVKYKKVLDQRKKQEEKFTKILEEDVEIDLHTIHIDDIPGGISPNQMTGIMMIVDESKRVDILPAGIN